MSNVTISNNEARLLGNQTLQRGPNTRLDIESTKGGIVTAENSTMMHQHSANKNQNLDVRPTKGVVDHGSIKRPRGVRPDDEDEEEEVVDDVDDSNSNNSHDDEEDHRRGEAIGTHRKEDQTVVGHHDDMLLNSRNELGGTVNRFTSSHHTTNKN